MNIVITGGSRGIGAAAVRRFCDGQNKVWFLYAASSAAAAQLAEETGATALQADVADADSVLAAFAQIPDPDVLVCNAGISHYGLISDISPDAWDRLFAVNVKGVYQCVRAALPAFLKKQSGCIAMTASMWGISGASCEAAYSATKGAVIALGKSLAKELAPSGIRVNCVAPGVIKTDMLSCFTPEDLQSLAADTPLGRLGTPEEVADALYWLCSAESRFVTGQVLSVDGGFIL
ncbi:MAG: SDR family oxidoreductase [Oscillospiraceae bacterium]|nr:SDR family oxidoreductase [Oscillospiraceae bacterium]